MDIGTFLYMQIFIFCGFFFLYNLGPIGSGSRISSTSYKFLKATVSREMVLSLPDSSVKLYLLCGRLWFLYLKFVLFALKVSKLFLVLFYLNVLLKCLILPKAAELLSCCDKGCPKVANSHVKGFQKSLQSIKKSEKIWWGEHPRNDNPKKFYNHKRFFRKHLFQFLDPNTKASIWWDGCPFIFITGTLWGAGNFPS